MKEIYQEALNQWNKELKNLRLFWKILAIVFWISTVGVVWSIFKLVEFLFFKS